MTHFLSKFHFFASVFFVLAITFFIAPPYVRAIEIEQRGMAPTLHTAPLPHARYLYRPPPKIFEPNTINLKQAPFKPGKSPRIDHGTWCTQRYDTYRRSDNSYQILGGGRVPCVSPSPK